MKNKQRNWLPCYKCGAKHTNPMSSSLCPDCGVKMREERVRAQERVRVQEEALRLAMYKQNDPVTAAMDAAYGFDNEQRGALNDMFQAFYDAIQENRSNE